jgi:hypothetical protein
MGRVGFIAHIRVIGVWGVHFYRFYGPQLPSTSEKCCKLVWELGGVILEFRAKTAMTSLDRDFARWTRPICRLLHTRVLVWSMVSPLHVFVRGGSGRVQFQQLYAAADAENRLVFAYLASLVRRSCSPLALPQGTCAICCPLAVAQRPPPPRTCKAPFF